MRAINFKTVQSAFFFGLILLFGLVALMLIRPFAYPIFWAAVIAVIFHPLYRFVDKHLKHPSISSAISVILVVVVLFLPLVLISTLLVNESVDIYQKVSEGNYVEKLEGASSILSSPILAPYAEQIKTEWSVQAATFAKNISVFIFSQIKAITANSLWFTAMFVVMLYILYYFFKDGKRMLMRLMHLSPLGDKYEKMLFARFLSTTRATLKSTFIIGGIQGVLGWLLFAATGVEGAFIWAVILAVISLIPAVGSLFVWGPIGLVMLFIGNFWAGMIILIFGAVVISNVDNVLRPPLVGRDTQMHPLLVFFATLSGVAIFGPSGFIIGPVLMALFLAVMSIYDHYYKNELSKN